MLVSEKERIITLAVQLIEELDTCSDAGLIDTVLAAVNNNDADMLEGL